MKDFFKGKFATGLVVVATVILAGVAIFTALQLYKLRAPNAPESNPLAWDCSKYTFSVSSAGVVTIQNLSSRDEPAQQAKVYINGNLVATLEVPALPKGQSKTLGTVQVPSGGFSWRVDGTKDCRSSGSSAESCKLLTFTISQNSPTLTPTNVPGNTATLTPTTFVPTISNTPTPTDEPIGGISSTPTPTVTPLLTATVAPTPTTITVAPPSIASPPTCDSQKPNAPTITSVIKTGTKAVLTWTKVDQATHYVISYGTTPENLQYGVPNTGNVTTYTIGSLNSTSTYYFTVYAVNNCMPSVGSTILGSVSGTSSTGSNLTATPTSSVTRDGSTLPDAGSGTITLFTFGAGIVLITFALLLAI